MSALTGLGAAAISPTTAHRATAPIRRINAPETSSQYHRWFSGKFFKGLAITIAATLVLLTFFKAFVAETFYVPSGSMKETLQISDRFVVTRLTNEVNRGDIVVFYDTPGWTAANAEAASLRRNPIVRTLKMSGIIPSRDNDIMVKRVIGVGGDHIVCCDFFGELVLNGEPLNEAAYLARGMVPSKKDFEVIVPAGKLFVMGDNRSNSADSRKFIDHPAGPFVAETDVVGRVTHTFWPAQHARAHHNPFAVFDAQDG